jgi:hypothetical protein
VQALQLEGGAARLRHLHDRGNAAGVVRGELRVDRRGMVEHRPGAGKVGDVGVVLVREHRVGGQAELLGALDLAVPVGALDQAHHEAQAVAAGDGGHGMHAVLGARLVGLDGETEAAPPGMAGLDVAGCGLDQLEREFEALAFLRVDRQVDVAARRVVDQQQQPRQQLVQHALALRRLVAGEQRRELDGDAVAPLRARRRPVLRRFDAGRVDGGDRRPVGVQIAARRRLAARTFAEHVEAVAQARRAATLRRRALERFADRLAEHELPPEQLERAHGRGHHGLRAEPLEQARRLLRVRQGCLRQFERARRQAGQRLLHAAGLAAGRAFEVGPAELVGGQRHRGRAVGHPQQRLGQPHQRAALGTGDRVLAQQRFQRPERRRRVAHRLHPGPCQRLHLAPVERICQRLQPVAHHRQFLAQGRRQASGRQRARRHAGARISGLRRIDRPRHGISWSKAGAEMQAGARARVSPA